MSKLERLETLYKSKDKIKSIIKTVTRQSIKDMIDLTGLTKLWTSKQALANISYYNELEGFDKYLPFEELEEIYEENINDRR